MNRLAMLVAIVLVAVATASIVTAATTPDPPEGVAERNWIPMGDQLGFVVLEAAPLPSAPPGTPERVLLLTPPASGYFMAKTADGWRRLIVVEPIKGPGSAG